jgi:hypothetical protein
VCTHVQNAYCRGRVGAAGRSGLLVEQGRCGIGCPTGLLGHERRAARRRAVLLPAAGFTQQSDADTGDEQWQAALKLSSGNAITSGVSAVDQSVEKLSDSQLLNATNHGAQNMGNGIVLQSPNGVLSKIPTGRSIVYHATVPVDGKKVNVDIYFVYGANVQFNLNCYWTTEQAKVKQACSLVLLTLEIKAASQ